MKRKVIDVKYRKDSKSFPDWLKYEITILNENGTTTKIPAYGKDLQDALSRVAHDYRVETIGKKVSKFPWWGWMIGWFGYLLMVIGVTIGTDNEEWFVGGILLPVLTIVVLNRWSIEQNRDQIKNDKRRTN